MRLRKKMGSSRARLFAQNVDERLPGIVIWSDRPYLEHFTRGHWNRLKITTHVKYMLIKSRACFFLRSPKRRRQLGHRHKGLRDPKIDEHSRKSLILVQQMTIYHFNVDVSKASNMNTNISHAWIFTNVIFYESVCPWIFINVVFHESGDRVDICYSSDPSSVTVTS